MFAVMEWIRENYSRYWRKINFSNTSRHRPLIEFLPRKVGKYQRPLTFYQKKLLLVFEKNNFL